MGSSHTLDQLDTRFDDSHAIANAGLLLPATLAERLGIEQTADALIDLGDRPGAAHPGRKLLTLVHAMLAGGDCIDDAEVLRCGQTATVLGHRVVAPSTLGTFLRSFSFGHVRQLDRLTEQPLTRAWAAGAGPGDGPMTMDLDSTVCEVHGYHKQGAAYGYTHTLGYHPVAGNQPYSSSQNRQDRTRYPSEVGDREQERVAKLGQVRLDNICLGPDQVRQRGGCSAPKARTRTSSSETGERIGPTQVRRGPDRLRQDTRHAPTPPAALLGG